MRSILALTDQMNPKEKAIIALQNLNLTKESINTLSIDDAKKKIGLQFSLLYPQTLSTDANNAPILLESFQFLTSNDALLKEIITPKVTHTVLVASPSAANALVADFFAKKAGAAKKASEPTTILTQGEANKLVAGFMAMREKKAALVSAPAPSSISVSPTALAPSLSASTDDDSSGAAPVAGNILAQARMFGRKSPQPSPPPSNESQLDHHQPAAMAPH